MPNKKGPSSPLATFIRMEMERWNISNNYAAERLGVELSTLTNWRQGKYQPSEGLLPKLAKLLRVDVKMLRERM